MKMKKLLSILLSSAMVLSTLPMIANAQTTTDPYLIYSENFDGKTMADFSDWTLPTNVVDPVISTVKTGYGDSLVLGKSGQCNIDLIPADVTGAVAKDKIKVSFDVKPNGAQGKGDVAVKLKLEGVTDSSEVGLVHFAYWNQIHRKYSGSYQDYTNCNSYSRTVMYHCEVILDFETGKETISIYKEDGSALVDNFEYTTIDLTDYAGKTINGLQLLSYNSYGDEYSDTYFDNIKIEYVVERAEVTDDSFKIYSGNSVNTDSTKVNADADKIVIDFGATMNEDSLKGVTITNVTDNKTLAYTGEVRGTTYVMTLTDLLGYGKNYKITVPATAATEKDGIEIGSEYVYNFTTINKTIFAENFNGKAFADLPAINNSIGWNFQNEGTNDVVKVDDVRNEALLKKTSTNAASSVQYWFVAAPTGKIKFKFDVKTNDGTIVVKLGDIGLLFTNGATMYRAHSGGLIDHIGGFTQGAWYSFEYTLDYQNNTIYMTRTDESGNDVNATFAVSNMSSIKQVNYLWFNTYTVKSMDTYYDNIDISYVIETPSVSESDVKIYVGETVVGSKTDVSPRADKITINLNAKMDEATVDSAVTLVDEDDNSVAFDGEMDGTTYVMTLIDKLADEKDYTLTVGANAATVRGEKLGEDFVYMFSTTTKDAETILYKENFDGKTLSDLNLYNSTDKTGWQFADKAAIDDTLFAVEDGIFKALSANGSVANAKVTFGQYNVSDIGRIKLSFDVKPGGSMSTASLSGNAFMPNLGFTSGGRVRLNSLYRIGVTNSSDNDFMAYDTGIWHSCSLVYDFNREVIEVYICPEGGSITKKEFTEVDFSRYTIINTVQLQSHGSGTTDTYWDNVKVEIDSLDPVVTSNYVKVYTDDVEEDKTNVTPTANKIVVDFNATMEEETLDGAITLTNVTDGKTVSFTGDIVKTKYVMTLNERLLPNKDYKLSISKDVENIKGVALGDDFTTTFKTNAGKVDLILTGITQNSADIKKLSALTAGEDATVSIDVKNSTGIAKDVILIYNYFSGNTLKKSVVSDIKVLENAYDTTVTDTVKIESLSGVDCVKVMLWDDFTNITPLSENITLID